MFKFSLLKKKIKVFLFSSFDIDLLDLNNVICSAFLFVRLSLSHILGRMLLKLSWVDSRFFFCFIIQCIFPFFMGFFFEFFRVTRVALDYFFFFIFARSTSFRRNTFNLIQLIYFILQY